jgi:hypothetical protein
MNDIDLGNETIYTPLNKNSTLIDKINFVLNIIKTVLLFILIVGVCILVFEIKKTGTDQIKTILNKTELLIDTVQIDIENEKKNIDIIMGQVLNITTELYNNIEKDDLIIYISKIIKNTANITYDIQNVLKNMNMTKLNSDLNTFFVFIDSLSNNLKPEVEKILVEIVPFINTVKNFQNYTEYFINGAIGCVDSFDVCKNIWKN